MKDSPSKLKVLITNTLMLYLLQFSTYLFSFLTIPYQTRILGPQLFGVLGVALAVMSYFQLFLDFGFMLSATEEIAENRDDKSFISKKILSVAVIKLTFTIVSFLILGLMLKFIKPLREYRLLYIIYLSAFSVNSFLPDYLFRGIEKMSAVTLRTVFVKLFTCLLTFVFLKEQSDYIVIPVLMLLGNLGAVLWAYLYIFKVMKMPVERITVGIVFNDFKRSAFFFLSRIATTVYNATNTVILGFVDKSGISTGYYTSADKLLNTAKSGLSPISDSIYPYMVRNKDFKLIRKILLVLEPVIIAGCVFTGIFAEPICSLLFGKAFAPSSKILIAFLPAIAAILPNYLLGFPTLSAISLSRIANTSILAGSFIHIAGLLILFFTNSLSAVNLAMMTSVSECSILLFRITAVIKNRNRFRG